MVFRLGAQRDADQQAWTELNDVIADHAQRLDSLEHEDMQYNDCLNLVADHCQNLTKDTDKNLRSQLDVFANELKITVGTLEGGLNTTITDAKGGFDKFSADATSLITQIDHKIIQIQARLTEHDCRFQNLGPGGLHAAHSGGNVEKNSFLQHGVFNMATPVKETNEHDSMPEPDGATDALISSRD